MAIGKSIVNFFKAAAKHNKHISDKSKMSSQISRHQRVVDGRRKALDTANKKLAKSNNNLNLAEANINSFNTRIRGVQNKLGNTNNNIKTQTDIIIDPKSSKKQIRDAQTQLTRLTQEQQNQLQDLNNLKKSIKTFKNDRKTAKKDVKKHTKAQTQANTKFDTATNNYNKYINDMNNYQDPGLGVRTAARIMRDPASLLTEPAKFGAKYVLPTGMGMGTGYLMAPGEPEGPELTPERQALRMATETTPPAYSMQNGIGPVPQDQWMASAPPAPLVVGNPTEAYSNFAPGPEHLPDVPQDEWDSYAPVQITNPMKEAIRIQLERERQAQATNN